MATRLTNDMRQAIAHKALQQRFGQTIATLRKLIGALANRIYSDTFKDILAKIDAQPKGWLPETDGIRVQLGITVAVIDFNGHIQGGGWSGSRRNILEVSRNPDAINRRFPDKWNGRARTAYDADHAFAVEYDRLQAELAELDERISTVGRDTRAALAKFTTVEKLLAGWPEIEPFTKGVTPTPPATAVMVPVSKLNEALGLPVEEEA